MYKGGGGVPIFPPFFFELAHAGRPPTTSSNSTSSKIFPTHAVSGGQTGVTHSHTAKGKKTKQINYHFVNNPNMRQQQCTSFFPFFWIENSFQLGIIVESPACSYVINRNFRAKIMSWIPGEIRLYVNVCMYVSLSYIKHIVSSSKLKECDSYCWRWGPRKRER